MDATLMGGCPENHPNTPRAQPASSSLDPQETNVERKQSTKWGVRRDRLTSDVAFRHSGWQHDRTLIRAALARCSAPQNRLERYDACGSSAWLVQAIDDPQRVKIIASYCHDRFCRPCAAAHARQVAGNLARQLDRGTYRFITLTVASRQKSLADLINKLVHAFRKLRSRPIWTNNVRGGAAFLEVKYNRNGEHWHPHLHIICEGRYIDQGELSREWQRITTDSYIVDIRRITDATRAVQYVAKYAGKPLSNTFLNRPDRLDEAICSLRGRRLCTTFGSWRQILLSETDDEHLWTPVCTLATLRLLAVSGDSHAIAVLKAIGEHQSCKRHATARASPTDLRACSKREFAQSDSHAARSAARTLTRRQSNSTVT